MSRRLAEWFSWAFSKDITAAFKGAEKKIDPGVLLGELTKATTWAVESIRPDANAAGQKEQDQYKINRESFDKTAADVAAKAAGKVSMPKSQHLWQRLSKSAANVFRNKERIRPKPKGDAGPPGGGAAAKVDATERTTDVLERFRAALLEGIDNEVAADNKDVVRSVVEAMKPIAYPNNSVTLTAAFVDCCAV